MTFRSTLEVTAGGIHEQDDREPDQKGAYLAALLEVQPQWSYGKSSLHISHVGPSAPCAVGGNRRKVTFLLSWSSSPKRLLEPVLRVYLLSRVEELNSGFL